LFQPEDGSQAVEDSERLNRDSEDERLRICGRLIGGQRVEVGAGVVRTSDHQSLERRHQHVRHQQSDDQER
jgi:hypothetical protein